MTEPQPAAREYSREEIEEWAAQGEKYFANPDNISTNLWKIARQLLIERDRLTTALEAADEAVFIAYANVPYAYTAEAKRRHFLTKPSIDRHRDKLLATRAAGAGGEKTDG